MIQMSGIRKTFRDGLRAVEVLGDFTLHVKPIERSRPRDCLRHARREGGRVAMATAQMNDEEGINGIKVTPLVDVTLVLLIVFMVTASVIAKAAIEVDLPRAAHGGEITQRTLAVVISKEGRTFLDGAETDDEHLVEAVRVAQQRGEDVQAVVGADRAATHGAVTHLLDVLKGAGVTKFAIQIEKAG